MNERNLKNAFFRLVNALFVIIKITLSFVEVWLGIYFRINTRENINVSEQQGRPLSISNAY